jgi:hypothetical protein
MDLVAEKLNLILGILRANRGKGDSGQHPHLPQASR